MIVERSKKTMCKLTEGQARADRIIQREMLPVGTRMRRARGWDEWKAAFDELEELWKAAKSVTGYGGGHEVPQANPDSPTP
jgi:hypothetical protein